MGQSSSSSSSHESSKSGWYRSGKKGSTGNEVGNAAAAAAAAAPRHYLLDEAEMCRVQGSFEELLDAASNAVVAFEGETGLEAALNELCAQKQVSGEIIAQNLTESAICAQEEEQPKISSEPTPMDDNGGLEQGVVNGKKICAKLGLPLMFGIVLGRMFGKAKATAAISGTEFVDVVARSTRGTTSDIRGVLFEGAAGPGASEISKNGFAALVGFLFYLVGNKKQIDVRGLFEGFKFFAETQSARDGESKCELNFLMFNRWCSNQMPSLQESHHKCMSANFLKVQREGDEVIPGTVNAKSWMLLENSEVLCPGDIFALSCADGRTQHPWNFLFSTNRDGLSFDALTKSIIGYPGPTLVVIRDSLGYTFGALVSDRWREASKFFGKSDSVLCSFHPRFALYFTRTDGTEVGTGNYQFLRTRGKIGAHGIGWGGDDFGPRLWIDRNFEQCRAAEFDLTYEEGDLRPRNPDGTKTFKPYIIEAWGLGGDDALKRQEEEHKALEKMRIDRRKVDRKAFADSAFDRQFLLGKNFAHQEHSNQRTGNS